MTEITIKPCPFCGGTDLKFNSEKDFNELLLERYRDNRDDAPAMRMSCKLCKLDMWDFGVGRDYCERKAELINKWNRRAYE